jgi:glycolate oxidase
VDKRQYMPWVFDPASITAMCDVRRVFDPDQRANRGKIFPSHACREWRAGGVP